MTVILSKLHRNRAISGAGSRSPENRSRMSELRFLDQVEPVLKRPM